MTYHTYVRIYDSYLAHIFIIQSLLVFENATVLSCWPHLIRNARKNRAKLRDSSNYDLIVDNIKRMNKCGSLRMFMCRRDVMMKY